MKKGLFVIFLICSITQILAQKKVGILQVPAIRAFCSINVNGESVLPSGRIVSPAGQLLRITHDPFGMKLSPDGSKIVTLHDGVFTLINVTTLDATRVPSYDQKIKSPFSNGSYLGLAFTADSKKIFLSGGDNGAVILYDLERMETVDSISLNGKVDGILYEDSFTSDLILNQNNSELLILDRGNFRMIRYDLKAKKIVASIPVGRQPFGLALSADGKTAIVANVGMYSYPLITGANKENVDSIMISHHPYGNDTKESNEGTEVEGRKIPGVGSANAPEAMSVFTIDLATNKVVDKFKTGFQIGQMIEGTEVVGGASPNSIAVGKDFAYVTNATNDNISIIDLKNHKIKGHINLKVDKRIDQYRGLLPFGITISKDEKTLYVALLGFNAVAVVDIATQKTKGLIPTGWGPTRVLLGKDEKDLYVITCRGLGAGPNGGQGFKAPIQGTYIGDIQLGSFQKIAIPNIEDLKAYTKKCISNTFVDTMVLATKDNPLPVLPGITETPIKYVVYITKENRTYDEVFGQFENANGDSSLARFGVNCEYTIPDSLRPKFKNLKVTPNHRKAAKQFALSDNFY
ncbi:MAG: phosphoesterase, partial [Bacteroidota bacterium]